MDWGVYTLPRLLAFPQQPIDKHHWNNGFHPGSGTALADLLTVPMRRSSGSSAADMQQILWPQVYPPPLKGYGEHLCAPYCRSLILISSSGYADIGHGNVCLLRVTAITILPIAIWQGRSDQMKKYNGCGLVQRVSKLKPCVSQYLLLNRMPGNLNKLGNLWL